MSLRDRLLDARWRFLTANNPLADAKALLSPDTRDAIEAELREHFTPEPGIFYGIPFPVSAALPSDVAAVFFSGPEPFDPRHPERTVVIRKGAS